MPGVFATIGGLLLILGVGILARALFADRSRGRRRCPKCWYDLDSLASMRCPECGREAASEFEFRRTRRHIRGVLAGLAVMVVGLAVVSVPGFRAGSWVRSVPSTVLVWLFPTCAAGDGPAARWPVAAKQLVDETARRAQAGPLWVWQRRALVRGGIGL